MTFGSSTERDLTLTETTPGPFHSVPSRSTGNGRNPRQVLLSNFDVHVTNLCDPRLSRSGRLKLYYITVDELSYLVTLMYSEDYKCQCCSYTVGGFQTSFIYTTRRYGNLLPKSFVCVLPRLFWVDGPLSSAEVPLTSPSMVGSFLRPESAGRRAPGLRETLPVICIKGTSVGPGRRVSLVHPHRRREDNGDSGRKPTRQLSKNRPRGHQDRVGAVNRTVNRVSRSPCVSLVLSVTSSTCLEDCNVKPGGLSVSVPSHRDHWDPASHFRCERG